MKRAIKFFFLIQVLFILSACYPHPHSPRPPRAPRPPRPGPPEYIVTPPEDPDLR